jgi:hypothetical protein
METGAQILDESRTPEEWAEVFARRGMTVSARTLRTKARKLGACTVIGHGAMLITPQQLDRILEDAKCRSNHTSEETSGGHVEKLSSMAKRSPATGVSALAHLQKQARGTGSRKKRPGKDVVTLLETRQTH